MKDENGKDEEVKPVKRGRGRPKMADALKNKADNIKKKSTVNKIKRVAKGVEPTQMELLALEYSNASLCFKDSYITVKMAAFLAVYEKTKHIGKACKASTVSRSSFYEWKEKNDVFRACAEEVKEFFLDDLENIAENIVMDTEHKGQTTMAIFLLKTQARERGYVEKTEVETTLEVVGFDYEEV